jgi:hypothetical protein
MNEELLRALQQQQGQQSTQPMLGISGQAQPVGQVQGFLGDPQGQGQGQVTSSPVKGGGSDKREKLDWGKSFDTMLYGLAAALMAQGQPPAAPGKGPGNPYQIKSFL